MDKFQLVDELRSIYPLQVLFSVSGLKKQTYFYIRNKDDFDFKNIEVINKIEEIYYKHRANYGYRRITDELNVQGIKINSKKVIRIMRKLSLTKEKYNSYLKEISISTDNVVERQFKADAPNKKWTTDVTEFICFWGKLYLSVLLDMYAGDVVSYSISHHPDYDQIEDMLNKAFEQYHDLDGLIIHSDQGWQYSYYKYIRSLQEHKIVQSMSRKGNCLDNAIIESFFGVLKKEMFIGHELDFDNYDQLKTAIEEYIDYYNNVRIKHKLGGLSPKAYRNQYFQSHK